jgi:hypothetical protein
MYGFTSDSRALGVEARESAAMVTQEGVDMGGPYVGSGTEGPLFRNSFLAEPNCHGKSRFPFDYAREKPIRLSANSATVWRGTDGALLLSAHAEQTARSGRGQTLNSLLP